MGKMCVLLLLCVCVCENFFIFNLHIPVFNLTWTQQVCVWVCRQLNQQKLPYSHNHLQCNKFQDFTVCVRFFLYILNIKSPSNQMKKKPSSRNKPKRNRNTKINNYYFPFWTIAMWCDFNRNDRKKETKKNIK